MDAHGALYHFIIKGMKLKAIFKEDDDESWGRPLKGVSRKKIQEGRATVTGW